MSLIDLLERFTRTGRVARKAKDLHVETLIKLYGCNNPPKEVRDVPELMVIWDEKCVGAQGLKSNSIEFPNDASKLALSNGLNLLKRMRAYQK